MSALLSRKHISLGDAGRLVAEAKGSAKPIHPTTISRWIKHGIRTAYGVIKLPPSYVGGALVVAEDDLGQFLEAVAAAKLAARTTGEGAR